MLWRRAAMALGRRSATTMVCRRTSASARPKDSSGEQRSGPRRLAVAAEAGAPAVPTLHSAPCRRGGRPSRAPRVMPGPATAAHAGSGRPHLGPPQMRKRWRLRLRRRRSSPSHHPGCVDDHQGGLLHRGALASLTGVACATGWRRQRRCMGTSGRREEVQRHPQQLAKITIQTTFLLAWAYTCSSCS
ncbi:unnamed protein product [Urochloa humidicola]